MAEIYLSLGAGVQSSTMALQISCGELPYKPRGAIFADTGDEPKAVYRWLDWLEPRLSFPVYRVKKSGDESLSQASLRPRLSGKTGKTYFRFFAPIFSLNPDGTKGMFPRKCTTDFKIVPIMQFIRRAVGGECMRAWRGRHRDALKALRLAKVNKESRPDWAWDECQADPLAISLIGISTDEATRVKPSREPWILNRHPLIDAEMSRIDCLDWMKSRGYPQPPKSACVFCPYHSDEIWRQLKAESPEEFENAARFEDQLQALQHQKELAVGHELGKEFLHSSRVPLRLVDFTLKKEPQLNLFENECEGMCGV